MIILHNNNEHSTSTNIANSTNGNNIYIYIYTLYISTQESTNYITHIDWNEVT